MIKSQKNLTNIFYICLDPVNFETYEIKKLDLSQFTKKFINRLIETKNKLVFSSEEDCKDFCKNYFDDLVKRRNKLQREYDKLYNAWFKKCFKLNKASTYDEPEPTDEYIKVMNEESSFLGINRLVYVESYNKYIDTGFLIEIITKNYKNTPGGVANPVKHVIVHNKGLDDLDDFLMKTKYVSL